MARDPSFPPPLSELAKSGISVASSPTIGMGVALDSDGLLPALLKFPAVTVDPPNPTKGQAWYRTDTDQFSVYNGTTVKRVALV